jgi:hypothetical protein
MPDPERKFPDPADRLPDARSRPWTRHIRLQGGAVQGQGPMLNIIAISDHFSANKFSANKFLANKFSANKFSANKLAIFFK